MKRSLSSQNALIFGLMVLVGVIFIIILNVHSESNQEVRDILLEREKLQQKTSSAFLINNSQGKIEDVIRHFEHVVEGGIGNSFLEFSQKNYDYLQSINFHGKLCTFDNNNNKIFSSHSGIQYDFDFTSFVEEAKTSGKRIITPGFKDNNNAYNFAIIYPIITDDTYQGYFRLIIPIQEFFDPFVIDSKIESQFLTVIDKDGIIVYPDIPFGGMYVFDDKVIENMDFDQQMIDTAKKVIFGGETHTYTFPFMGSTALSTGMPLRINEEQVFTTYITIPTTIIYQQTEQVYENVEGIVLLLMGIVSISFVVMFWYLSKMVKRTQELEVEYMKKDLELAKKEKFTIVGELAARLAHDLRNPLSIIKNTSEILKFRNPNLDEKSYEQFKIQERAIQRISHQIEDVLGYVRTRHSIFHNVKLNELLEESLNSIEIPEKIKINRPKNDISIMGDPEQLQVVFSNLIMNSIQAMDGENGEINFGFKENSNDVEIEVEDSGIGIPDEQHDKIFEPLFTTKQQGTGLGLASVKTIVETHGGKIKLKSGKPTIFHITIPKTHKINKQKFAETLFASR